MLKIFKVVGSTSPIPKTGKNEVLLWTDNWDDWYTYSTQYVVFVYDDGGNRHRIGNVKIGQFGMKPEQRRPDLKEEFEFIGDEFFSLGQDDEYYENLTKLGTDIRDR